MTTTTAITYLRDGAAAISLDAISLTERVLAYPGFTSHSGSVDNRHHYGEGGLLRHTAEVAQLCMANATLGADWGHRVDMRVLWLAAVAHDAGKLFDYEPRQHVVASRGSDVEYGPTSWHKTTHHRLVHHVARSAILWSAAVAETGLCRDIEEQVLHCILSHHGSPAFGSPITPKTREAWILHLADMLSARMDDCDRVDLR